MNGRVYESKRLKVKNYNLKENQTIGQVKSKNYNSFAPLQERNLECFNCHNYGHKEIECILMEISERPRILERKRSCGRKNIKRGMPYFFENTR